MRSLERLNESRFELIIVDNGSSEPFETTKNWSFPVNIIHTGENLGFAGGNEVGMKAATGEYFYLINNDTEFQGPFVKPIVDCFKNHPSLGMLSTLIRFWDTGLLQYAGSTELSPITLRNSGIGTGEKDATPYRGFKKTAFIHGASVILPSKVYHEVGGMWEPFFLYYEEYDWCTRVKKLGYDIGVLGDVEILHKESASVGRMSPLKIYHMTRNRMLYARRNIYLYWPITLLYLLFVVGLRDALKFAISGQTKLLYPLMRGLVHGFTKNIN